MGFLIYLVTICDSVNFGAMSLLIISIISIFIYMVIASESFNDNESEFYTKRIKKIVFRAVIPLIIFISFVPSSKNMAAIILIPKIVNNETVKNIGEKSTDLLQLKLDEWIKSMSENK